MPQLRIEVDTCDRSLMWELAGEPSSLAAGQEWPPPDLPDTTVTYNGTIGHKAMGFPETLLLLVALPTATSTAANLLPDWIQARFQGRAEAVRVNRTTIELDHGKITRIILEELEQ